MLYKRGVGYLLSGVHIIGQIHGLEAFGVVDLVMYPINFKNGHIYHYNYKVPHSSAGVLNLNI